MVQASRPQADHISNYPPPSDPGPYTADQWAEYLQISFTGDQQLLQGPIARYVNEMVVTDNGTNKVYVDKGAGWVNGHLLVSTEKEAFSIPPGPAAQRWDIVVMCENNSALPCVITNAGRILIFPDTPTEYATPTAIPPYSARLAIIRGVDGAGPPVLDTTTAKYMVELARYQIDNTPTISAQEDRRSWAATPTAGFHRLRENILGAGLNIVTWDNIPPAWHSLKIVGQARLTAAAIAGDLQMRFNNDATNSYWDLRWDFDAAGASAFNAGVAQTAFLYVAVLTAATGTAGRASPVEILIPNYKETTFHKTFRASNAAYEDGLGGNLQLTESAGWWGNTAAITRIDLFPSANNFVEGSTFSLYGLG